ncbi:MAG: bifunctional riboflavin kinase/FAD synthetase [Clostridiales bacterium]|nr:bifunctional riboflavin kinase/FAD synthetase [Clostridiales bacterium]
MRLTFCETPKNKNPVLLLGTFDGVHKGHQKLIQKGKKRSAERQRPLVISTLHPHPLRLIAQKTVPKEITTMLERGMILAKMEVDEMLVWHFTKKLRDLSPKDFIEQMILPINPAHIIVGYDYTFGKKGEGTTRMLKEMGDTYGFSVEEIPPVTNGGKIISSTEIRLLLEKGEVAQANHLLSRPYSLQGEVVHGKKAGGKLGFPTANLLPSPEKILPAFGVYIAKVQTAQGIYPAVINVGSQPTIPSGKTTLEAHLLNQNTDLYGQKIRVFLLKEIRKEKKFSTPTDLQKQVQIDIATAKTYFLSTPL